MMYLPGFLRVNVLYGSCPQWIIQEGIYIGPTNWHTDMARLRVTVGMIPGPTVPIPCGLI
jgi:hypothetical protein